MKKKILWVILTILSALLTIVLIAAFFFAVIMGDPQEEASPAITSQPQLPASEMIEISGTADLPSLIEDYPVPVLAFLNGAGLELTSGTAADLPYEGGLARVIDLTYTAPTGEVIRTRTIYPAAALSLVERGDYVLSSAGSYALAGLNAVRMENSGSIRFHAQNENAVYVLIMPRMETETAANLRKALQLISIRKEENTEQ